MKLACRKHTWCCWQCHKQTIFTVSSHFRPDLLWTFYGPPRVHQPSKCQTKIKMFTMLKNRNFQNDETFKISCFFFPKQLQHLNFGFMISKPAGIQNPDILEPWTAHSHLCTQKSNLWTFWPEEAFLLPSSFLSSLSSVAFLAFWRLRRPRRLAEALAIWRHAASRKACKPPKQVAPFSL